jgi:hypothetical protein
VDERTGGEIRSGDAFSVGPRKVEQDDRPLTRSDVAPTVLASIEQLARGFDLVRGRSSIELQFEDGLFETGWIKRRLQVKQLGEFEPVFREAVQSDEPLERVSKVLVIA